MNFKIKILYFISMLLLLVFIYNYIFPLFQTTYSSASGMGMHMSGEMHNNNSSQGYVIPINYVLIPLLFFFMLLILYKIVSYTNANNKVQKCPRCNTIIESEEWRVCPMCGRKLPPS